MTIRDFLSRLHAAVQSYGPDRIKAALWDREFRGGRWACLDDTRGDPIYGFIEKYCKGQNLLDVGCGSGNTLEEAQSIYNRYTGVDVSGVALDLAQHRAERCGIEERITLVRADMNDFTPGERFPAILFRESLGYNPMSRIKLILDRYATFLEPNGVFIVRLCNPRKYAGVTKILDESYSLVERLVSEKPPLVIYVFRIRAGKAGSPVSQHSSAAEPQDLPDRLQAANTFAYLQ